MNKNAKCAIRIILMAVILLGIFLWIRSAPCRDAQRLINAIEVGDSALVQQMLEDGVDPNQSNAKVSQWWQLVEYSATRPLSVACYAGNLDIVNLLVSHGATAEYIEHTGWSPLREALHRVDPDDVEIVKLLLENGADPTIVESDISAVFAAADMWPAPRGDKFYSTGYDAQTAADITQIVILLLGEGSVDTQTKCGETLLMYAARRGNICLAEYLIDRGCDMDIRDNQGKTAMDYAIEANQQDMRLLFEGNED